MNFKRIYIVGNAKGSYRARALLHHLSALPDTSYYHNDPNFYSSKKNQLLSKLLWKLLRIIDRGYDLIKLSLADKIYILPMSRLSGIETTIAKTLKKSIIGEFYISMYDTFVNDRKTVKENSLKAKKLLRIDQQLFDNCETIVFLNASEREYYLNIIHRNSLTEKTILIPLATNAKKKAILPFAHNKDKVINLCWWGTYIPLHGLDKIIESAQYLIRKNLNFKMYIFGDTEEKSKPYQEKVKSLNLAHLIFIESSKNFADKSLENFLAENCDIAFGNFGDSEKAKIVMVNKVVEAASMAIPVISQQTNALAEYFTDGESIIFCESTPESIATQVIKLSENTDLMKKIATNAYNIYSDNFSTDAYINKIKTIL